MRYQWVTGAVGSTTIAQTTSSTYSATNEGTCRVSLTDANGCTGESVAFVVKQISPITVQFAPAGSLCTSDAAVSLAGTPTGGMFSGPGVSGNQFSPSQSGAGTFPLIYTIAGPTACLSGTATQTVVVQAVLTVAFPSDLYIRRGESVVLPGPIGASYEYTWSPTTTLSNPAQANPMARPVSTTTYTLRVRNAAGCVATSTLRVYVQVPLYVPTAFTPNGDGVNDTWELLNAADVPNITVTVFNRLGNVVFYSPGYPIPFTGAGLDNGVYSYVIQYGALPVRLAGSLTPIR